MMEYFQEMPIWGVGLFFSFLAGMATGLGALPVFFTRNVSLQLQDIFMGFAAGVMLAATSFSLIIPGLEAAGNGSKAAMIISGGILLGGFFIHLVDKYLPHEHFFKGPEGSNALHLRGVWLFIIAITIHNFPEGLAVGVGFGGGDVSNGIPLALGIGLQNIPEGLVVALSLVSHHYSIKKSFGIALLTGLVEPIGGLLGVAIVSIFAPLLPWALAFAAGAMLFVISHEIIPETHRKGFSKEATFGLMIGFVIMLFLDVTFG